MQRSAIRVLCFAVAACLPWVALIFGQIRRPWATGLLIGVGYFMAASALSLAYQSRLDDSAAVSNVHFALTVVIPFALPIGAYFVRSLRLSGAGGMIAGLVLGVVVATILLDVLGLRSIRVRF